MCTFFQAFLLSGTGAGFWTVTTASDDVVLVLFPLARRKPTQFQSKGQLHLLEVPCHGSGHARGYKAPPGKPIKRLHPLNHHQPGINHGKLSICTSQCTQRQHIRELCPAATAFPVFPNLNCILHHRQRSLTIRASPRDTISLSSSDQSKPSFVATRIP